MNVRVLALLGATALAVHTAASVTTCPVSVQGRTTSTLADPITKVVDDVNDAEKNVDQDTALSPDFGSGSQDLSTGSQSLQSADVGSPSSTSLTTNSTLATGGDLSVSTDANTTGSDDTTGSAGVSTTPSSPTTTPSSHTTTPSTTTATPSTTTTPSTTPAPVSTPTSVSHPTTPVASPSTDAPTTDAPTPDSAASGEGAIASALTGQRTLQVTTTGTASTPSAVDTLAGTATNTSGTLAGTPTTTGTSTTAVTPGTPSTPATAVPTNTSLTPSTTAANATAPANAIDTQDLVCDSTFYSTWNTLGLVCGGSGIDVAAAVAASSCVIYSGAAGATDGSTCISICAFPSCDQDVWVYGAENGLASSVYDGYSLQSFLPTTVVAALKARSSTVSTFLANSTLSDSAQCAYDSETSFSACACSALLVDRDSSGSLADAAKKELRASDEANGVITKDKTTTAGQVVAATSKSVAGVTVAITGIAAIASTAVGGLTSAGASFAAAGSTVAITTVEICQFGVLINQLQLDGKSSALAQFGKAMAPAAFTFLPFGKLSKTTADNHSAVVNGTGRRLEDSASSDEGSDATQLSGIEKYSRQLDIHEDMLFLVTLAGVFCVMASVVGLFGLGYVLAGVVMPRTEYLEKFFDKMIGLEVLVAILSQYTIGVTATFQIYYSTKNESFTDPKCLLAVAAILFLASGILVYGYVVIKKHEADLRDVGTVQHVKKTVNMRYGPLYEEYKFKNRYFFAAKMMVALTTGVVTGCAFMSGKAQVSIILAINVLFFLYLEIQSPHHSKFVQTTTSFVAIMKIAVLVLTFFLVTAASSDGFPTSLQNGISVAIVGLNLFVLALLMIRSLYTFWQKLKLQRDAAYDQEEQTTQDYFKDETPVQSKDRALSHDKHPMALQSPYANVTSHGPYVPDHETEHCQPTIDATRSAGASQSIAHDRHAYGQRREDVVEL